MRSSSSRSIAATSRRKLRIAIASERYRRRAGARAGSDLSKAFGGLRAVRGVSLTIMPGDRKAIIGPNGAGKTTLFNLITGILPAVVGPGAAVRPGRDALAEPPAHRARHGAHVPGDKPFSKAVGARQRAAGDQGPPRLEIRDVAASCRPIATSTTRRTSCWRAPRFLIRKDTEVRYLSHGEQRQLEIVVGLASDPDILAARRAGCRPVIGRVGGDGEVPARARPQNGDPV